MGDADVFNRLDAEAQEFSAQDRVSEAVAARDAAWREAVARVRDNIDACRSRDCFMCSQCRAALDAVLAAMEAK